MTDAHDLHDDGEPTRPHRSRWTLAVVLTALAMIGVGLVSFVLVSTGGAGGGHRRGTRTVAATIGDPVQLPAGYGTPEALTANGTRPGVWFLDADATSESVFFMDPTTGHLSQWSFANASDPLSYGIQAGIAVAPSGTVWLGIDKTLVRLDPSTGTLQRIALPTVPTDASLQGGPGGIGNVPRIFSTHSVTSIAAEADGDVAITTSWSTAILVYDPTTGAFSMDVLPGTSVPTAVTATPDGELIASSPRTKAVDAIDPDGTVHQTTQYAYALRCRSGTCATSTGGHQATVLRDGGDRGGTAQSSAATSGATAAPTFTKQAVQVAGPVQFQVGTAPTPIAGGSMIAPTTNGFAVVDPTTGTTSAYTLPTSRCTSQPGPAGTTTPPTTGTCQAAPTGYVVDTAGNIWYTANFGTANVYELAVGDY